MPDPQISLSSVHELEYCIIDLLDKIRSDVVDLLQQDQQNTSAAADLSVALGTLKVVAETACQLVKNGKSEDQCSDSENISFPDTRLLDLLYCTNCHPLRLAIFL